MQREIILDGGTERCNMEDMPRKARLEEMAESAET